MGNYKDNEDNYVHGMDWFDEDFHDSELSNYIKWRYSLIEKFIVEEVLEVGSGDRSMTKLISQNRTGVRKLISIEPSSTLFELHSNKFNFPPYVSFHCLDLFSIKKETFGLFDTIVLTHVLEHIVDDRGALRYLSDLLVPKGNLLVQVPAMKSLYSVHDEILGHHRRYTKKSLLSIIDKNRFVVKDIWYQDTIGMLGSLYYFKIKKIKLKSADGIQLVKSQGKIYDQYIIPTQSFIEKYVRFPFGLSLTAIIEKK